MNSRTYSTVPKEPIVHSNCFQGRQVPGSIVVDIDPRNDRLQSTKPGSPTPPTEYEPSSEALADGPQGVAAEDPLSDDESLPYPDGSQSDSSEGGVLACKVGDKECRVTNDLLSNLEKKPLPPVRSHKQLAKTAHGVRVLAKQLESATVRLPMNSIMIITKARDNGLVYLTKDMAEWMLHQRKKTVVYVDAHLRHSKRFDPEGIIREAFNGEDRLRYWTSQMIREQPELFDLVVTLGGDGTVLYTSTLFQEVVPPTLSFALGSLGFLTNFQFEDFRQILVDAYQKGVSTNLRMRFACRVHNERGDLICEQQVLNELTIDRGPSPWVTMLELYGDGSLITVAQADGLIVATPTGSTAYSLSAGGSLVHPSVNGMCITPICPHTLSFRPIILPDTMLLKIKVPMRARATAWASFDGRERVELQKGYYVTVCASQFPFPTVRSSKDEYFRSVSSVLNWNKRDEQKSFVHLLSDKNKQKYYRQEHGALPDREDRGASPDDESEVAEAEQLAANDGDDTDYEIDYNDADELSASMTDAERYDLEHIGPINQNARNLQRKLAKGSVDQKATFTIGSGTPASSSSISSTTSSPNK